MIRHLALIAGWVGIGVGSWGLMSLERGGWFVFAWAVLITLAVLNGVLWAWGRKGR